MPDLAAGDERFRHDRGAAEPGVAAAIAAFAAGAGAEQAVLTALAASRLLVPVVAVLADELGPAGTASPPGPGRAAAGNGHVPGQGEKASEMAMPVIVAVDGRRALPAFTSAATLREWKPDGRPVPVPAASVWQSAVQDGAAVIIDIAGPVPLAIEGARLTALAAGTAAPALHEDPDVWQIAAAEAARLAPGIRVRLSEPKGGLDLTLELAPPEGAARPVPDEIARQIGDAVTARLASRARCGMAVLVRPPGQTRARPAWPATRPR